MGSNGKQEETIELPPGFRFHPTDEELITQYLSPKVLDSSFNAIAIGEADLNKSEPWDLPWKAKMGESEWYFFCVRDRKYPTGMRTNRATEAGYWKATGKDKEVERGEILVGMKKTLVFYKGRAPKGEKTDWVMHEYRLEGRVSIPQTAQNEWVICRVFQKTSGGKKTPIADMYKYAQLILPSFSETGGQASHVPCFSGPAPEDDVKPAQNNMIINNNNNNNCFSSASSSSSVILSEQNQQNFTMTLQNNNNNSLYAPNLEYPESIFAQDQSALRMLCEDSNKNISGQNMDMDMNMNMSSVVSNFDMAERSFEDPDEPSTSGALVDLASIWNY